MCLFSNRSVQDCIEPSQNRFLQQHCLSGRSFVATEYKSWLKNSKGAKGMLHGSMVLPKKKQTKRRTQSPAIPFKHPTFCSNLIGVDWRLVMLLGLMKIDLLFLFSAFYLRHSRRRLQCRRSHNQQDNRVWCVTIALWFIAQLNTTWSIDDKSIALGRRCRQARQYTERRGAGRCWWCWWSAAGGSTPRANQVSNIVFRKSNHIILRTSVWIVGAHTRTPARTYSY